MNPYFIDEPAVISFSGGRSSGYMLRKIIDAHGGTLPDHISVMFSNTGKEMSQTLDFVRDCAENWGVDITWLELGFMEKVGETKGGNSIWYKGYHIVTYNSASRNGEPFDILLNAMPAIPNIVNMACTAYLKTRIMRMYCDDIGMERGCLTVMGLRYDEPSRIANNHGKKIEGFEGYCPLYVDKVDKSVVGDFWRNNDFDLQLPNNNGVTDWGNCDLCYKKGKKKRASIMQTRPDLAQWWIDAEKKKGQQFRPDEPSYEQMSVFATDQNSLFDFSDDETIPCFCSD